VPAALLLDDSTVDRRGQCRGRPGAGCAIPDPFPTSPRPARESVAAPLLPRLGLARARIASSQFKISARRTPNVELRSATSAIWSTFP
jgi:hypothetical protein